MTVLSSIIVIVIISDSECCLCISTCFGLTDLEIKGSSPDNTAKWGESKGEEVRTVAEAVLQTVQGSVKGSTQCRSTSGKECSLVSRICYIESHCLDSMMSK